MSNKYELTSETEIFLGRKLFRIRAKISFGWVKKGEKGGWVEKETNLSQVYGDAWVSGDAQVSGNARVYGNARVSGDAQVYGDARVSKSVIHIIGLLWDVTITDMHIQIGCELHTISDWSKFKDSRIKLMSSEALAFWAEHKTWIIKTAKKNEVKRDTKKAKAA